MSKKKGLSLEEKRKRMMDIFYEKKEFFQLKELEKIAPKEKGIIVQAVKDVVQSLVDDNLVDTEKIGTSVYFWAFPSKAQNLRKRKLDDLELKVEESRKKVRNVNLKIEDAKVGREDGDDRDNVLQKLASLESKKAEILEKLQKYKDCDPVALQQLNSESEVAVDAANRWTDNLFSIKSWCKTKFFIEEETLNKQFNIPADLDYIETK